MTDPRTDASLFTHPMAASPVWQAGRFHIDLRTPCVMGIVNLTPDSFSDGGHYNQTRAALAHAEHLLADGATMLDVGAESTRPGAQAVPLEQEWQRLAPFLEEAVRWQVPISVDTYKPHIMQRALDRGVDAINDVWALRHPAPDGLTGLDVVSAHAQCGVCLMHMHLEPATMQVAPMSGDAVPRVVSFLEERAQALAERGVHRHRVVLDYGIGFGKTVEQNFALLARQSELMALGFPVLAGWSRKSSLGAATGREQPQDRVAASVAAAVLAVQAGARVLRVHDVAATVDAVKVWQFVVSQQR